jgi:hypothetical protein
VPPRPSLNRKPGARDRRVNEAGFKTTRFSIARATRAHSVSTHSVQFDFLHATRAVGSKGKAIQVTAVDL